VFCVTVLAVLVFDEAVELGFGFDDS